jgi:dihydrodiol dehydrogenase / D-xylose 1-dehydrogenase (NADP)
MSTPPLRWGIISTGGIANKFAEAVANVEGTEVLGVGSRTQERARNFAGRHAIPRPYGSYEELVNDRDIDAIYIATPHPLHMDNTLMALEAGKHVLVEKPFAINARQAQRMVEKAREKGLFLMEAMWTRFLPTAVKVRELVQAGHIGPLRWVRASLGFMAEYEPQGRLFNLQLGGGSLLDVGIYPVSYAAMLLGTEPESVNSDVHIGATGVDEMFVATLRYPGGKLAQLSGALRLTLHRDAVVFGESGRLYVQPSFMKSEAIQHFVDYEACESWHLPIQGNGFEYQVREVVQRVAAGELESPVMSWDDTVNIMRILDRIRAGWGIVYPGDEA